MNILKKTALVVIDLQKGIVTMQTKPHDASDVIDNSVRLIKAFHSADMPVFFIHVDFLG